MIGGGRGGRTRTDGGRDNCGTHKQTDRGMNNADNGTDANPPAAYTHGFPPFLPPSLSIPSTTDDARSDIRKGCPPLHPPSGVANSYAIQPAVGGGGGGGGGRKILASFFEHFRDARARAQQVRPLPMPSLCRAICRDKRAYTHPSIQPALLVVVVSYCQRRTCACVGTGCDIIEMMAHLI